MKPLITPTVNLNGTSRETLIANLMGVMHALREVDKAMALASPHGRDYQTSRIDGENLVYRATDAWRERRQIILAMAREMEEQAVAIQEQGKPTNRKLSREIGGQPFPVIEVLQDNGGAEVLLRHALRTPEFAEIVLCYLPANEYTPLVTWDRNTNDGGCYRGHYYTLDDLREALSDYEQRTKIGVKMTADEIKNSNSLGAQQLAREAMRAD